MKTLVSTYKSSKRAKKSRTQKPGESTQSYIQSVLGHYYEMNASMSEDNKVSHMMKGVAEDIYQALLIKKSTQNFNKWCQYIEDMKPKRIGGRKFDRLSNVTPIAMGHSCPGYHT